MFRNKGSTHRSYRLQVIWRRRPSNGWKNEAKRNLAPSTSSKAYPVGTPCGRDPALRIPDMSTNTFMDIPVRSRSIHLTASTHTLST